jgi:aspartyl-tRNA(Asn)/glutamyl-tRNA(Gln) amidotransferase subunit B
MSYASFVGLEIHIQLATQTKVFCSCRANFGDEPNTNICPVCMGYPGTLPALNEKAIRLGYVVARALNCTLAEQCEFERKNYFYPDLPKNYQISQFAAPLGTNGYVDLEFRKRRKRVRIRECHLEEDAGKMIHAGDESLLDFNRAGTPLLEIVTEPDLEIGEEAEHLLQQFRQLVRYLGVCDGNMEEGSLRCDANVSVNTQGAGLGTKVEIKNMNSFRFVRKALNYEIARQEDILERGGSVVQETRLWNENRDVSEPMRVKESSNDYRFFPEPDLPPFRTDEAFLASVEESLIEFPRARVARFIQEHELSEAQAEFLCEERSVADYYESVINAGAAPDAVAVWLMGDVRRLLNRTGLELSSSPLTPERLAQLLSLLANGRIHGKLAKQTLAAVFDDDLDPEQIIADRGWEQITDPEQIASLVADVIAGNQDAVAQISAGDARPHGFLVGEVMKASAGRADPALVQRILQERLAVQFVQVLSFGGAISGRPRSDGTVGPGDVAELIDMVRSDVALPTEIRYEALDLGEFLSEEVTPRDWAALLHATAKRIVSNDARGIVVTTGTDTLSYTAALLYWLFGSSSTPIILAASSPDRESAMITFKRAVQVATTSTGGVRVVINGEEFEPINLKFERVPGSSNSPSFTIWNREALRVRPLGGLPSDLDIEELTTRMEEATRRTHVAKVFPGIQASSICALIDAGVRLFVLELYDTGTASVRESQFSLRDALHYGQAHGVTFYCTSQQEGIVDFAGYTTSRELWKEGAVPMGALTTESVFARILAVLITSDSWDSPEIAARMEQAT